MTINSTTDDLIAEIEAAAMDATPGDWSASEEPECEIGIRGGCDELVCASIPNIHDALFIELADPANVLALVARIKELTEDRDRLKRMSDNYCALGMDASARIKELE